MTQDEKNALADALATKFSHAERRTLLNELGVAPEDVTIRAATARDEAWEIVGYFERRAALERLRNKVQLDAQGRSTPVQAQRFLVPFDRNAFFAGRESVLRTIEETLSRGTPAAVTQAQAISGLGGVGKTQVALEFAYRVRDRYSDVFWILAESEDTLRVGFAAIAKRLDIEVAARDAQAAARAVKQWLEANRGWLLVFDNADDPALIRPFLPRAGSGHILLTSRAQVLQQLGVAAPLHLNELSPDESVQFLRRRTGRESETDKSEVESMAVLARELGHLPLALEQAAAYIVELQESFANYLRAFKRERLKLLECAQPIAGDYERSVATTWSMNFRRIEQESPASVELLRLLSFLGADAVPDELIRGGMLLWPAPLREALMRGDELVLGKLLQPLTRYSLARHDRNRETVSVHRLVQDVVRDGLDDKARRARARAVVVALAVQFPDPADYRNWPACERFLQHVRAGVRWIAEFDFRFDEAGRLLNQTALYLEEREEYEDALALFVRSAAIREYMSVQAGYTQPNIVVALRNLGALRTKLGRYEEAEADLRRAVEAAERVAREDRIQTDRDILPAALLTLGHLLQVRGREHEALPILRRAAAHIGKNPSASRMDQAAAAHMLASLERTLGHTAEAETHYRRAIELLEQAGPAAIPVLANVRLGFSEIRLSEGRFSDAESLIQRSLADMERAYGADHIDAVIYLRKLAKVYVEQGRYGQAEPLLRRELGACRRAFGDEHIETARATDLLADCLRHQSRFDEAETLYAQAVAVAERVLGPEHHELIDFITGFALLHMDRGRHDEAERLFARADEIEAGRPAPSPIDPMRANNRALLRENKGRYDDAAALYREALAQQERLWGPDHPSTALIRHNIAHAEERRGNYAEAAQHAERALAIWQRTLGPDHRHVARACDTLAALRLQLGDAASAEDLWRRGLAIREKAFGGDHIETAQSMYNLALLCRRRGDLAGAEPLLRKALEIAAAREPGSDDHSAIAIVLAETLSESDRLDEATPLFELGLAIRRGLYPVPHPKIAHALSAWAGHLERSGHRDEAAVQLRDALDQMERVYGPAHPNIATLLHNLAMVEMARDNLAESEALERRSVEIRARVLGEHHEDTAFSRTHLGQIAAARGNYQEARRQIEPVLAQYRSAPPINASAQFGALLQSVEPALRMGQYAEARRRAEEALALVPPTDPRAAMLRGQLLASIGHALLKQADWVNAERTLREAHEAISRQSRGDSEEEAAMILVGIAETRRQQGDLSQARELAERALSLLQSQSAPNEPAIASAHNILGGVLEHQREYDAAEREYQRAIELAGDGPEGELLGAAAANNLGNILAFKGRADEAIARFNQARQILVRRLGADHPDVAQILYNGGLRLVRSERSAEGLPMMREAARISAAALGAAHPTTRLIHRGLGEKLLEEGDLEGARTAFEEVLAEMPAGDAADPHQVMQDRLHLADALEELGDWTAARTQRERLFDMAEAKSGADSELAATARIAAGNTCLVGGDAQAASEHLERALPIARVRVTNKVFLATALNNAGVALNVLGDTARARERFEEAVLTHEQHGQHESETVTALVHLAQALDHDGKSDAAETRRREALALIVGGVAVIPAALTATVCSLVERLRTRQDFAGARSLIDSALTCETSLDDEGRRELTRLREELSAR